MNAKSFWEEEYKRNLTHHVNQNSVIARDFLKSLDFTPGFLPVFKNSKSLIEIGCGSGDMCYLAKQTYNYENVLGLDLSENVLVGAKKKYPEINFIVCDVKDDDLRRLGIYDICLSSNVLEHFRDPYHVIDRSLEICKFFVAIVPYRQPEDIEPIDGAGGHISSFSEESFRRYNILDGFIFKTAGWVHSAKGEDPRQLAVLLKGNIL